MEWYMWLGIGYLSWVFVSVLIGLINSRNYGFFNTILYFIVGFIYGVVVSPFLFFISLYTYLMYDTPQYKTWTIHELTEDNKTTLRQLGFDENVEFISNNNIAYGGFRWNNGEIYIAYNGRMGVKYLFRMSKEQKMLFKLLKGLPNNGDTKGE
jgi:uncharacterized membrane protein